MNVGGQEHICIESCALRGFFILRIYVLVKSERQEHISAAVLGQEHVVIADFFGRQPHHSCVGRSYVYNWKIHKQYIGQALQKRCKYGGIRKWMIFVKFHSLTSLK